MRASVVTEREPSGETWSGRSTNNQDLVLSCFGGPDVKVFLFTDQSGSLKVSITRDAERRDGS